MELIFIAIIGFSAAFITSISGGGGIIAVPAMLAMGLPPISALALNRLSDVGVIIGAPWKYVASKSVDWKLVCLSIVPLSIGSFIGANLTLNLPDSVLRALVVMAVFIGFFLIRNRNQVETLRATPRRTITGLLFFVLVGTWSGALGMAGATFAVLVYVYCFRCNYLEGRATHVLAAIPETCISAFILTHGADVSFAAILTVLSSSIAGAYAGSFVAVKKGSVFIQRGMALMVFVMIAKFVLLPPL